MTTRSLLPAEKVERNRAYQRRYNHSEKGRATQARYRNSTKGKRYYMQWSTSENGKQRLHANRLRWQRTEGGRNYRRAANAKPENKTHKLIYHLRRFGLTVDQYNTMLELQHGKCAICRSGQNLHGDRPIRMAVDHCHNTGRVRGLLCNKCNTTLARLNDDVSLMRSFISYLEKT